ncbi:MAG TPA: restriction endonuclease subunit S [Idiomarina abyssalis]|jgi:type I restriction enzyme S subunit|uniref:restriction endonuclease subunit S n=1 Tax=Idiomarina TaxID=135575 RepID=UPI000C4A5A01|nr:MULTISPECIES: restriction endonuclease subunit S [Idiomarina]MAB22068.1 restriction endonuclease subunit S [Idiomarina sp.]MBH93307.1 restriction endonuclease subunit S [Idiomarina sp.]HAS13822.1 restriction endonuclease subunit S [Idiomarina abyssalis]|tara:strand:+ start:23920 stop:25116 length:1197 start_codon:yes stop_codon:yes gene_type:complete
MTDKQTVKFGDICREVKLTTKDPIADGYERYIGLEHLDSGSLKIKRWGIVAEDNPSFTRVFKKGHILFGKRRPYLKKAAIAEFDGICSGDIIVLEPKPNSLLLKELVRHLVQSETVWNWAVLNSSGSLSPRTKFSVLSKLEISVPSYPQESCLNILRDAESALSASDAVVTRLIEAKTAAAYSLMLEGNWYRELFGKDPASIPEGWKLLTVGDVLNDTQYGLSDSLEAHGRYPVLRMMNITNGYVDPNDLKYLDWPKEEASKYILNYGDIVFNRTNSMEWVGRTGIFELDGDYLFASYLIRLVANEKKLTPYYLTQFLNLPLIQYRLKAFATPGVSQANINPGSLKSLPILVPPLNRVKEIEKVLREFDSELNVAKQHHQRMVQFMESIKSKYFEQVT